MCQRLLRWMFVSSLAVAVSAFTPNSYSQVVTLTSGNSSVTINTSGTGAGMNSWTVDGFNPLALQWFWYRAGAMTSESTINTLSSPTITPTSSSQTRISYASSAYSVSVDYKLNGQAPGSGLSTMTEGISIRNLSSTAVTFSFFQYSDFNLGTTGDDVLLQTGFGGLYSYAIQTNGPIRMIESSVTPGANRAEAAFYPSTLNSLNDGAITVLNNNTHAGPGNVTWAFEWDITLGAFGAANDTFGISKTLDVRCRSPRPQRCAWLVEGRWRCIAGAEPGNKSLTTDNSKRKG